VLAKIVPDAARGDPGGECRREDVISERQGVW
jgi:hypothetical protein